MEAGWEEAEGSTGLLDGRDWSVLTLHTQISEMEQGMAWGSGSALELGSRLGKTLQSALVVFDGRDQGSFSLHTHKPNAVGR